MSKKEQYDKKIELIKKFLESDGSIELLKKIQNDSIFSVKMDNFKVQQETEYTKNSNKTRK